MRINPLIAVGIPTWGKVSIAWARAYRHLGGPLGSTMVELEPVVGKPIAEARNNLMQQAIAAKCDFLFMLGDDNLPSGDTIINMVRRMWEHPEIDLLTGVYWTKAWPTFPYIWRGLQRGPYLDWKMGEFIEVDYAGCDCLLIRLSDDVKALGPEWFSTSWYWEPEQAGPSELATEDFFFYTKARKAGIKLWCDTSVQCLHEDRNSGMIFGLTTQMPQAGSEYDPGLPDGETDIAPLIKVADIGCGTEHPFFGHVDTVKIVRFDGDTQVQPDYRCDIRHLPVPDQSFDVVHSRHVLEHFGRDEVMKVLEEWTRILRVGGEFRISVPNIIFAMQQILEMEAETIEPHYYPWWQLYGQQATEYDYHKNGFTPRRLKALLERLGIFENIEVTEGDEGQNLYAKATKVSHPVPYSITPEWDVIAEQEKIEISGLTPLVPAPTHINGTTIDTLSSYSIGELIQEQSKIQV